MIFRNGILAIFLFAFATLGSFLYFANSSGNIARYMELNQQASLYCVTLGLWLDDSECAVNIKEDIKESIPTPVPTITSNYIDRDEVPVEKVVTDGKTVSNNYFGVDKQYIDSQINNIRSEISKLPPAIVYNTNTATVNKDFLTKQVDAVYNSIGRSVSDVNTSITDLTTTDVEEEDNLYYTDSRVSTYLSGSTTLTSSLNYWTKSGDDLSYISGKVGIGTTTPNSLFGVLDLIDFNLTDLNTKVGYQAGKNLISTAISNTFFGYQAGMGSSTAPSTSMDSNTGFGYQVLLNNTSGSFNYASGYQAMLMNSTGSSNVAIGRGTLDANTTGSFNVAMGSNALGASIDGIENVALGTSALQNNTTGDANVGIGRSACLSVLGNNNVCIGRSALSSNTGSGGVAIGYYSGAYETADNTFYVNNTDYESSSAEKTNSLMYGIFGDFLNVNPKLGVSTTSPSARFAVKGAGNTTGRLIAFSGSTNIERFTMLDSGATGFGTTSPASKLSITQSANTSAGGIWLAGTDGDYRSIYMSDTSGTLSFAGGDTAGASNIATLNSAGAWTNASDRSYKDNIVNLDTKYNLETLMKIEPRFYTMKGSGKPQIGFIAQELKLVLPEVVEGEEGSMGISYGNMVALLVTAVKEINVKVGKLVSEIKVLVLDSITAKVAIFDSAEIKTASISNGLEMKDQVSGEIYCIMIKNGDWDKTRGKCSEVVNTTQESNTNTNNSNSANNSTPVTENSTTTTSSSPETTPTTSTTTPPTQESDNSGSSSSEPTETVTEPSPSPEPTPTTTADPTPTPSTVVETPVTIEPPQEPSQTEVPKSEPAPEPEPEPAPGQAPDAVN